MQVQGGNIFIVTAPSGAGKTTLVAALLAADRQVQLSVSYTTRPPREGEVHGRHYHFIDRATFEAMIGRGEFLEHADVYGNYYGTSETWIREQLSTGRDILLEIDGGIKPDNIAAAAAAGADTFVAGSAIFGKPDYKSVIDAMRVQLA